MYKLEAAQMPVRSAPSFTAAIVGHVSYGDFFEGHTQSQDHSGRRCVSALSLLSLLSLCSLSALSALSPPLSLILCL